MMTKPIVVLLVEDNPADADLTQEGFENGKILNRLFTVFDGEEALKFLRRQGAHADKPRPDLVLLDLNLPKRDGREVLEEMKRDGDLRHIPVVILTSSDAETDVLKAYKLQAAAYVTKPVNLLGFVKIVGAIESFWLGVVTFAGKNGEERAAP